MITRILIHGVLFLTPFAIYLLYRRFIRSHKDLETPYTILFASGLVLSSLALFVWAMFDGYEAGSTYEPARVEDGRIIPGKMTPPTTVDQN